MHQLDQSDTAIFKSQNPEDPRVGNFFCKNGTDCQVNIIGYPDDEGIRLNNGRPGAADAPNQILSAFTKMTPSTNRKFPSKINYLGLLNNKELSLEERHCLAREIVKNHISEKKFMITLGGGHDYGFPDAAGFVDNILENKKPLIPNIINNENPVIINFDAHLDVRPTDKGFHSGTPFRRLLDEYGSKINFYELGMQEHCNARPHLEWAKSKNAQIYFLDELRSNKVENVFLNSKPKTACWISLDMDVFSSALAPGCSASYGAGLDLKEFFAMLKFIIRKFHVFGIGFYEVSPPLDIDNRTAKLAALIMHKALTEWSENQS